MRKNVNNADAEEIEWTMVSVWNSSKLMEWNGINRVNGILIHIVGKGVQFIPPPPSFLDQPPPLPPPFSKIPPFLEI